MDKNAKTYLEQGIEAVEGCPLAHLLNVEQLVKPLGVVERGEVGLRHCLCHVELAWLGSV